LIGITLWDYFQTDDEGHPSINAHLQAIAGHSADAA
jgi:hypothetical protein